MTVVNFALKIASDQLIVTHKNPVMPCQISEATEKLSSRNNEFSTSNTDHGIAAECSDLLVSLVSHSVVSPLAPVCNPLRPSR
jgi:hypothetical protein